MIQRVAKKILQKNRVNEYKRVLQYALDHNYVLCSLKDWYLKYKDTGQKVFILRHDVDYDTNGSRRFFFIEKKLQVTSTYYFRWKTMKDSLMHEMHRNGFEVALHYETLASLAKKRGILKEDAIDDDVLSEAKNILSDEIQTFEQRYFKLYSICSHGDKRNRILKTPNYVLVDESFKRKYGLFFEAYDKKITRYFDAYVSDSSVYENFRWKHAGSPFQLIDEQRKTICLLTHPIHWNQSFVKNMEMLVKVYFDNR